MCRRAQGALWRAMRRVNGQIAFYPCRVFCRGLAPLITLRRQAGLRLTGHFLANHLAPSLGDRPLPAARGRLVDILNRQC